MVLQFDLKNAEVLEKADGSLEIIEKHGDSDSLILRGEHAKTLRDTYAEQLKNGAGKWRMNMQVSIEIAEPIGKLGLVS